MSDDSPRLRLYDDDDYAADEWHPQLPRARSKEPVLGSIIAWKVRAADGVKYDYAAIKAGNGRWYTTGPNSPKGFTWDELMGWMNSWTTVYDRQIVRNGYGEES